VGLGILRWPQAIKRYGSRSAYTKGNPTMTTDNLPQVGDKYRRGNQIREVRLLLGNGNVFVAQTEPGKSLYTLTISVKLLEKWEKVK
jgi:hypothetical protein